MLEVYFFILGLVNSVFLILLFLVRKNRLDLLYRFGWIYLLLAIFVVMPWKTSLVWGLIMLGLFIVQIIANLKSHPKMSE